MTARCPYTKDMFEEGDMKEKLIEAIAEIIDPVAFASIVEVDDHMRVALKGLRANARVKAKRVLAFLEGVPPLV